MIMTEHPGEDATPFEQADYEIRRVDHLIYVSLKYTRTVDVIKNIVARLIMTYDFVWDELLHQALQEKKIYEIPSAPGVKCNSLKKLHSDDETILKELEFYLLLRQFQNASYSAVQEYRRHVTMKATFANGDQQDLNIDIMTEYYKQAREFIEFIRKNYTSEQEAI
ncbi:MAG: hypothetical protein ACI8Y7_000733 [Candidatus Woesearchaeota archaeon]|jgi:hypothetical protein